MSIVLASAEQLPVLREQLAAASRVAVDTEFHAERRYLPQLLLVQLHVEGGDTWVVDPLVTGLLSGIAAELVATTWVVHGGHQDLRLLLDALGELPTTVLDTQIAAALVRPDHPVGYATLTADVLDVALDKGATLSDWSRRPLTDAQVRYAAGDVELLLPLWDAIETRVAALGRSEAVRAACDEARSRVADPPADDLLWRDLTGLRHLEPAQAAVAQELVAWREAVARGGDQPARSVISDGLILDLARRRPLSVNRMLDNRRFPRSVAKRHGADLVEVIARASRRPEWGWPRFVRADTPEALQLEMLQVCAHVLGRDADWSPRLVLPRQLLEDVILADPPASDPTSLEPILGTWRAALAGASLHDCLEGRLSLRIDEGAPRLVGP